MAAHTQTSFCLFVEFGSQVNSGGGRSPARVEDADCPCRVVVGGGASLLLPDASSWRLAAGHVTSGRSPPFSRWRR